MSDGDPRPRGWLTRTDAVTISAADTPPDEPPAYSLLLGQRFGRYTIVQALGRGGVGEVYEVEDDEDRRLALKILRGALADADQRRRFLREGRLAASVTHPNSIYIYGSEEIDGVPAIAMELAAGGSLKDRLAADGPLGVAEAVDTILQVIAGLAAVASAGVLHRDIKPSNCFVTRDGVVKIGDFGLAISSGARPDSGTLTGEHTFLGTAAFASPEQIRGEPLDVRSDIYSIGATLFALLTGEPPFSGTLVELLAQALQTPPPSPRDRRPEIPDALADAVLRCLEKDPAARYPSYDRLIEALVPFSSRRPAPAPLFDRVVASIVDDLLLTMPVLAIVAITEASTRAEAYVSTACGLLYFATIEGALGASPGKALMRLRVMHESGRPALPGIVVVRAATFFFVGRIVPLVAVSFAAPSSISEDDQVGIAGLVGLLLLFAGSRAANGWAGLHDRLTRTRVVRRVTSEARPSPLLPPQPETAPAFEYRAGPFSIAQPLHTVAPGTMLDGYDPALRRRVWVHVVGAETPAIPDARRRLARPGRLRWLAGRRSLDESWDAYEAPDGVRWSALREHPQPWDVLRVALRDVADEMVAADSDGEPLTVDQHHAWLTRRGVALLLDLPTVGPEAADKGRRAGTVGDLHRLAVVASGRSDASSRPPLPLQAQDLLAALEQGRFRDAAAVRTALDAQMGSEARLTRRRRSLHIAIAAAVPLAVAIVSMLVGGGEDRARAAVAPLAASLFLLSFWCPIGAVLFRGGLPLRALNLAVVRPDGTRASRHLIFLRSAVAWSPGFLFLVAVGIESAWLGAAALASFGLGALVALVTPQRGIPDRLVGTWLVPL